MKAHLGNLIPLLVTTRRRKLQWFGHTTRRMDSIAHAFLHGSVDGEMVKEGEDGKRLLGWMTSTHGRNSD